MNPYQQIKESLEERKTRTRGEVQTHIQILGDKVIALTRALQDDRELMPHLEGIQALLDEVKEKTSRYQEQRVWGETLQRLAKRAPKGPPTLPEAKGTRPEERPDLLASLLTEEAGLSSPE